MESVDKMLIVTVKLVVLTIEAGVVEAVNLLSVELLFDISTIDKAYLSDRGIIWGVGQAYELLWSWFLAPNVQVTEFNKENTGTEKLWSFFYELTLHEQNYCDCY